MVYYDTDSRLQFAREHADRLEAEMRRTRRLTRDEAGYPAWPGWARPSPPARSDYAAAGAGRLLHSRRSRGAVGPRAAELEQLPARGLSSECASLGGGALSERDVHAPGEGLDAGRHELAAKELPILDRNRDGDAACRVLP